MRSGITPDLVVSNPPGGELHNPVVERMSGDRDRESSELRRLAPRCGNEKPLRSERLTFKLLEGLS
jgi:hypothetical protein